MLAPHLLQIIEEVRAEALEVENFVHGRMDLNVKHGFDLFLVGMYRVEEGFVEAIDNKRCVTILLDGELTEKGKEAYSHLAEGSYLHVQRDHMGNIVAAAPFPRDEDYIKFREEHPKEDPMPETNWEDIS